MKLDFVVMTDGWDDADIRHEELEKALAQFDDTITVALSNDEHVQELNRDYRGKDKPTNVLSFPNSHGGGDIILALETLQREAVEQDKPFRDHFEHLVVHGCLHVMGYDHENDEDAEEMEALETKLCKTLGFVPYEAIG